MGNHGMNGLRRRNESMRNESLSSQMKSHMENRAMSKALAKEHQWCDDRIAALEAALRVAYAAVTAPLDGWRGELDRKACDAIRSVLAREVVDEQTSNRGSA